MSLLVWWNSKGTPPPQISCISIRCLFHAFYMHLDLWANGRKAFMYLHDYTLLHSVLHSNLNIHKNLTLLDTWTWPIIVPLGCEKKQGHGSSFCGRSARCSQIFTHYSKSSVHKHGYPMTEWWNRMSKLVEGRGGWLVDWAWKVVETRHVHNNSGMRLR